MRKLGKTISIFVFLFIIISMPKAYGDNLYINAQHQASIEVDTGTTTCTDYFAKTSGNAPLTVQMWTQLLWDTTRYKGSRTFFQFNMSNLTAISSPTISKIELNLYYLASVALNDGTNTSMHYAAIVNFTPSNEFALGTTDWDGMQTQPAYVISSKFDNDPIPAAGWKTFDINASHFTLFDDRENVWLSQLSWYDIVGACPPTTNYRGMRADWGLLSAGYYPYLNITYTTAAPPTGDTPVVNIPAYSMSINTNLTNGNYTDNPLNWSVAVTDNYATPIPDYFARWSFNATGTTQLDDRLIHNLTVSGATFETNSKFGGGYHFDGSNDYMNTSFYGGNGWGTNDLTVTAWINLSEYNAEQAIFATSDNTLLGGDGGILFWIDLGESIALGVSGQAGGRDISYSSIDVPKDQWVFIAATYELGKYPNIYINGTNVTTYSNNDGVSNHNSSYRLSIGKSSDNDLYFNGSIDEVRIYNRSLSALEVYELYTKTSPQYDCTLYANTTSKGTLNNINANETNIIGWDTTSVEAGYIQNITCTDYYKYSSQQVTSVFVDTILPNVANTVTNNSLYYHDIPQYNYVNFTGTCTDTNLFSCNMTVWQLNGTGTRVTLLNNSVKTDITGTSHVLNTTLNVEALANARYEIFMESYDSHTANKVKNLSWYHSPNTIVMDNQIYLEGDIKEELTTFLLSEKGDKYKFKITWQEDTLIHHLNITATGDLTFRADDGYKGHFVYYPTRRWIDFEGSNVKAVTVTPHDSNKYSLVIEHYYPTDEVEFQSIGDLNYAYSSTFFNVTNGFTFTATDFITNTSISNFTVLIYNYTTLLQNLSTTDGNVTTNLTTLDYGVNITSSGYVDNRTDNVTFTSGGSYTFYLSAANSLYLLVFDEQTNQYIDDRTVTLEVINYQNTSSSYTTTDGTKFISGFAVGEYEINYYAPGYTERSYYTTITGSDTQTIRLYLLNTSVGTYTNYEVVDESASALSNATIKMQKYFIDLSGWRTVEMSKSNDAGEGFFFAELYNTPYRFVIEYLGSTVATTQQTKLDTRVLYLKASLTSTGLQSYFQLGDATTDLSFNNNTDVWTFDFNSPSSKISKANLVIVKKDGFGDTVISNTSLAADSGAITYNQSAYNGDEGTFMAYGYLTTNIDNFAHIVEVASYTYKKAYQYFGLNGVLLSLMIIGTFAMVAVWSPSASIVMAIFGLIISVTTGLLYISWPILAGVIVAGGVLIFKLKV